MNMTIDFHRCAFRFDTKPSATILKALKAHNFRWQPGAQEWVRFSGWRGLPEGFADWVNTQYTGRTGPMDLDKARDVVDPMGAAFDTAYDESCRNACGL